MSTRETKNTSSRTADQSDTQYNSHDGEPIVTGFTYNRLMEYHLERRGVDEEGNKRPEQSLDNERSVIGDWLVQQKLSLSDIVGEELGARFNACLSEYLSELEGRQLAKQTISDRKSIVNKLRESYLELERTNGLPEEFGEALCCLAEKESISVPKFARETGVAESTMRAWMRRTQIPRLSSLKHIRRLERFFKVPTGTLSSRIPDAIWTKGPVRHCTTQWRNHQSELLRLRYGLIVFPDRLQEEWDDLVRFFTDSQWVSEHGLKRNSEWRIRWNSNRCVSAEVNRGFLQSFFGYLCLPPTAQDNRMAGLGFSRQELSLALLTDANLVIKFLYFRRSRAVSNAFNTATLCFLHLCMMLSRNKTGYLRQRAEFGKKLPRPVAEKDWQRWCKSNHLKLQEFRRKIKTSKKDRVRRTRDPFEPVRDTIRERQHPITVLFELSDRLESLTPLMERWSQVNWAIHCRNVFQVRLIGSNPLRSENFSMMTFIPKDAASFERACDSYRRSKIEKRPPDFAELYVETASTSNLYQLRDGSWRLRFNERDFKNEKGEDIERGVLNAPYDVDVVPSVWSALTEYLFIHRAVLNGSIKDVLREVRAGSGLPPLTSEHEYLIDHCPYVFRPGPHGIRSGRNRCIDERYGTGQFPARLLSSCIFSLTSRYLPESKGFHAHACRHLVATEYIKNHPNGYEEAAVALHNTAGIVRKHYAWVEVGDLIRPWNNYHEDIRAKYDQGKI